MLKSTLNFEGKVLTVRVVVRDSGKLTTGGPQTWWTDGAALKEKEIRGERKKERREEGEKWRRGEGEKEKEKEKTDATERGQGFRRTVAATTSTRSEGRSASVGQGQSDPTDPCVYLHLPSSSRRQ